jgi:hypothetical protein
MCMLAGCGRYGFDPGRGGSGDGGVDALDLDAPGAMVDGAGFDCAQTYTLTVNTSKVRIAGPDTWLNGEAACAADGLGHHLVEIANFVDQQKIEGFLGAAPAAWVGLSDRKAENVFLKVIGGLPAYLPWSAGQPSFPGPGCVILDPVAREYHDGDCAQSLKYVCECDGISEDPSTY